MSSEKSPYKESGLTGLESRRDPHLKKNKTIEPYDKPTVWGHWFRNGEEHHNSLCRLCEKPQWVVYATKCEGKK